MDWIFDFAAPDEFPEIAERSPPCSLGMAGREA
jgi:hypothetical protein